MEQHDLPRLVAQARDLRLEHGEQRHDDAAGDELEQEVAERHAARLGRRAGGGQHRQEAAAQVGAEHQAQCDVDADDVRRGERRDQQHDGEARIGEDREQRREQHVEQRVAGERGEDDLDPGRLGDRLGREHDPLQREDDEAEADQDEAEAADVGLLPREEQHDPDEDQEGRQPRQVEREHDHHQAGADVGAEHHRQRRRGRDQTLAGKRGDDQRGGGAALDEAGDAEPGKQRPEPVADAAAQQSAQVAAVDAQDAGAHVVRAPDEQRHAGEEVEEVLHRYQCAGFHGGERGVDDRERAVELVRRDHQRRRQRQHVALADLERQAVGEAVIHHLLGLDARRGAVAHQLDAEQQADAAHFADQRMARLDLVHPRRSPVSPSATRLGEQLFLFDHLERGERGGAADRALFVRVVAERAIAGDVEVAPGDQRGHRKDRAAQALAEDDHVGNDAVVLEREHRAGAAEADRNLVEDQQRAVAVAGVADDPVIVGRRDLDVGAADRLDDHRADILFLAEHVIEILGAAQVARSRAPEAAAAGIARRHVLGAGHQRPHVLAEHRFAADRDRVERRAVERVPHRQRLVPARGEPRELQRHPDRQRAAGREQHLAQRVGRERRELGGEVDGRLVREPARREGQGVERVPDRGHHVRMAVADLVHVVAVEIHDPPALDVLEPDPFARGERVEARRGQRLVQEMPRVGVEQRPRRAVHVLRLERAPQRRQIDVALGHRARGRQRVVHPRPARQCRHHGSEYVLVLVKLFIASCTPSL